MTEIKTIYDIIASEFNKALDVVEMMKRTEDDSFQMFVHMHLFGVIDGLGLSGRVKILSVNDDERKLNTFFVLDKY